MDAGHPDGGTLARIRVQGDACGLYGLAAPIMARKARSSTFAAGLPPK
ncbi:hypothetical protein AB0F18_11395 [Streptomyces sp. NPDC029216]